MLKECLDKIKPHLKNIIIDLQISVEWKVKLTIEINVIFSKDADEEHVVHSKSSNTEFNTIDNVNNVADEFLKTLLL